MSLRLRLFALVVLVGVTAVAATAWVTLRQASQQVTESAEADRATIEMITGALTEYGRAYGTWEGVTPVVQAQSTETGQRIRMVAAHGEVLVDTDHLAGGEARLPASPPIWVNPRPILDLPADVESPVTAAVDAVRRYRFQVVFSACLLRAGTYVSDTGEEFYGVPIYMPATGWPEVTVADDPERHLVVTPNIVRNDLRCHETAMEIGNRPVDEEPFSECLDYAEAEQAACLREAFSVEADGFAPVPAFVYLGAVDEQQTPPLATGPVLVSAALIALTAILATLLISQRMLRPIGALTAAARRLGNGSLTEQVPVTGNDELAGLARTFNGMAESLRRSEERHRRLVADVAHELRTPLSNLRGYLEALKDGVLAPDPQLFVSLHEETLLQQRMVDDLQDLALAEAGSLVYHWEPTELGAVLAASRAAHQAAADSAGVRLAVEVSGRIPVHVDPGRLRQVIANLVTNALRATEPGGIVRLGAVQVDSSAVLSVTDTGCGISAADLPHVFDRFWRADSARSRATGGSGLGLAIARQIVTDHGGTITVRSMAGTGTTFTITLPVRRGGAAHGGGTH